MRQNENHQEPSLKEQFTSRAFRAGTYSVVISVLAIVAVVVINLIVSAFPKTLTHLDLTDADLLALSDQTKQLISSLDQDVTVYQLIEEEGDTDEYITELLNRYHDLNRHFHAETLNVVLYPNFISQYTNQPLYKNSLVVVSDKRSAVISYFDIYDYSFDDASTEDNVIVKDLLFHGEEKLTTAVDFVTTDILPVVYSLSGHGESELDSLLLELIANDNMTLKGLNLIQHGAVPEDCSCLLINAPDADLSEEEKSLVLSYLEAGGNLLLISDYTKGSAFPNLYEVMDYYGMTCKQTVVFEGNSSHYYSSGLYILPNIPEHAITSAIRAGGYITMTPVSMPIYEKGTHRESLVLQPLLSTTEESYIKEDFDHRTTNEKESGDETGPFHLAMAATEEHDDVVTQLVWIGSGYLLNSDINSAVSGTNFDFLLGSLGWMTGSDSSISIHAKSLGYEDLNVSAAAANVWSLIFIILIPVALLLCGSVILYRRRKK